MSDSALNYEKIAHLYDSYLQYTGDLDFFLQECQAIAGSVLELMCGTGRISLPLLQAGVNLTCVDASEAMLAILRQKLASQGLKATVVEMDVTQLPWENAFDAVLLPFQSFHELQSEAAQVQLLQTVARSLRPGGLFICTLHNPVVRRQNLQQGRQHYGTFARQDAPGFVDLAVELDAIAPDGTVQGWQLLTELDEAKNAIAHYRLPLQFRLIEPLLFETLLAGANFSLEARFGNYDYSPFVPENSPYLITRSRLQSN
ncbi:MAG: class I SAM-dependent methyltransferase [Jaaginema sp. PMC 1079.18]|nr:class I SAM-dependent methyltransferase [Jaaginema sp. PMC 1080.18]MEC4853395.1 class I SAM-dependent methyltransferase [Jaaginema sp. PMC 1079.18]MEC4867222.1 class I SAM-dependent methyltransferase [Jaaginema sp. PMC 1078.18]